MNRDLPSVRRLGPAVAVILLHALVVMLAASFQVGRREDKNPQSLVLVTAPELTRNTPPETYPRDPTFLEQALRPGPDTPAIPSFAITLPPAADVPANPLSALGDFMVCGLGEDHIPLEHRERCEQMRAGVLAGPARPYAPTEAEAQRERQFERARVIQADPAMAGCFSQKLRDVVCDGDPRDNTVFPYRPGNSIVPCTGLRCYTLSR